MKGVIACWLAALGVGVLGSGCLTAGRFEQSVARAQRNLTTLNYEGAEETFARAEQFFGYASYVPGVGNQALNDIRARKALLHYWQRQYGAIIPHSDDPIGSLPRDNTELQFIVANAVYRSAQAQAKERQNDRQSVLQSIDTGIKAYLAVLRNSTRNEDAAFNYEYLVQLRGAILAGNGKPKGGDSGEETNPHGQPGGPPQQTGMSDFKIQIPLDRKESGDEKTGHDAGKSVARERKG
jgi:hypothetical protein